MDYKPISTLIPDPTFFYDFYEYEETIALELLPNFESRKMNIPDFDFKNWKKLDQKDVKTNLKLLAREI